jgi:hypothetical protein
MRYEVVVSFEVVASVLVEADSLDEAEKKAEKKIEKLDLPNELEAQDYCTYFDFGDGSLSVEGETGNDISSYSDDVFIK